MLVGTSWAGRAIRQHFRSRRLCVWAGLLSALALYLATLPLFSVLGFELAFAMALAGSIAAADLGAAAVRRLRATEAPALVKAVSPARLVAELTARAALAHVAALAPPLAILSLNGFRVQNCDWWFGLMAYALMPVVSVVIATGLGVACGFITGTRRVIGWLAPYLVILGFAVHSVWRFYAAPPVFSYNPLVGYFPGNLYDENIDFSAAFYWARLYQLMWLCALLAAVAVFVDVPDCAARAGRRPRGQRTKLGAAAIGFATIAFGLWWHSGSLGFNVNTADIAEALGGRHETEHFIIIYPRGGDIERDIELLAEDHEFRLAQLERTFGLELPGKIRSLYFRSADQKFRWIGARGVYMAKPWRKEIYIHHQSFPHQVLRHEIAHVIAGQFGDPLFHVSVQPFLGMPVLFNVGLIEGIAVASDWPDHFTKELTPHQSVKALAELGMLPPIENLMSVGFFSFSPAQSYTVAGSFLRYLYDEHGGVGPLSTLYRTGGDFFRAYGRPFTDLAVRWLRMIERIELPEGAAEVVRERFRHRSIFRKVCPHAIARKRQIVSQLERAGRTREAIRVARSICSDSPGEPRYQIQLADLLSRSGEPDKAAAIYDAIAAEENTVSSSLRAQALLRRIDQAARDGDFETANVLLDRAAKLPVNDSLLRNIETRRSVAKTTWPAAAELRSFFWGDATDALALIEIAEAAIAAEPDSGLAHYLRGRHLISEAQHLQAVVELSVALDFGLPHPLLVRECARLLAEIGYRTEAYDQVERAAQILQKPGQPRVIQLYGADWIERLEFRRTGILGPASLTSI